MSDLMLLALILIAAGGLSGFLAGVFGVGGGTVVVPVLYEVFVMLGVPDELRMPLCAGTSLALIVPTSIASFTSHRKTDSVNFGLLRLWSIPIIAGVIGGTHTVCQHPGSTAPCYPDSGSFCQKSRPRLYLIRDYSRRFAFTATLLVGSAKNRTAKAPSNLACAHPG
jgi:Sulfite exporter TauE/SafE